MCGALALNKEGAGQGREKERERERGEYLKRQIKVKILRIQFRKIFANL